MHQLVVNLPPDTDTNTRVVSNTDTNNSMNFHTDIDTGIKLHTNTDIIRCQYQYQENTRRS